MRYRTALAEEAHTVLETQIKPCAVDMTNCMVGEQLKKKLATVQLANNTIKHHIQDVSRY